MSFPAAIWQPTREEYFSALAPAGSAAGPHPGWSLLHGSGRMKLAERSLRAFGEVLTAQMMRWAASGTPGAVLSPWCEAVLESQEPTSAMLFGSAVESLVMPGDPMPAQFANDPKARSRAEIKARQILEHPEAGRYVRAPGAAHQVAHRWQDEASGLWFRMRLDLAYWFGGPPRPAVEDLKIWSRIDDDRQLERKVRDQGADLQAALYRRGCRDLWGVEPPHSLIVADPSILGRICVRRLSEETIAAADERLSRVAANLAACYGTGVFLDPAEGPREI